jgi:RND family efflux transporter MFP subunit
MTTQRSILKWSARALVVLALVAIGVGTRDRWRGWWERIAGGHATNAAASAPSIAAAPSADARGPVSLDLRRQQLIGVETTTVRRGAVGASVRTVGIVKADETRLTDVNVRVDGWIRDLRVDFTGQPVTKGQMLFTLFSPDLLTAEREYILALESRDDLRGSVVADARDRSESLVSAARHRLELLDVSAEELSRIDATREAAPTVTFRSPIDGFVLEKTAVTSMHVAPGQTLYRLANLDEVWVEADAYELDLARVRVGTAARVTLDAYPGTALTARVVFISPGLDPESRTAKVRLEMPNRDGRLRPGMYATVELATAQPAALVVPVDAVIDSGREQIVFIADGSGTFTPRRVTIGARGPDVVEILSGLEEGQRVASSATFFLDSESQLRAGVDVYNAPASSAPDAGGPVPTIAIAFSVEPDPAAPGPNTFTVTIKDASGQPLSGADASVQFFMPAMPMMNMPAIRSAATLKPAGPGVYRGSGELMMSGRWETTVTISRDGRRLGSMQTTVVVR